MKTTKTAQYAAEAANISFRRAFVKSGIDPAKRRVNKTRTTTADWYADLSSDMFKAYIETTGRTNSIVQSKGVTSILTKASMRSGEYSFTLGSPSTFARCSAVLKMFYNN
jgi:hypothetical protein